MIKFALKVLMSNIVQQESCVYYMVINMLKQTTMYVTT